jgi:hypothetical protein
MGPYGQEFYNPYNTMSGYANQMPQFYGQPSGAAAGTAAKGAGGASAGMSGIGGILGGAVQGVVGVVDWIKAGKERKKYLKESEQALAGLPQYAASQYAKTDLANAQSQANAIDPSIMMQYNKLQQGAANTAAMGQRNAMSGAEAINAAITGQNIAASQAPSIAAQQTQYAMANRGALSRALQGMTAEEQNVFNSKNAIANQMFNYKLGRLGAAEARKADAIKNVVGGVGAIGTGIGGFYK